MHENWALDDILKTHTVASTALELMRFARLLNKLRSSPGAIGGHREPQPLARRGTCSWPDTERIARIQEPSESAASGETLHCMVEGVGVAGAQ